MKFFIYISLLIQSVKKGYILKSYDVIVVVVHFVVRHSVYAARVRQLNDNQVSNQFNVLRMWHTKETKGMYLPRNCYLMYLDLAAV